MTLFPFPPGDPDQSNVLVPDGPLDPSQIVGDRLDSPTLPATASAKALRLILADLARRV